MGEDESEVAKGTRRWRDRRIWWALVIGAAPWVVSPFVSNSDAPTLWALGWLVLGIYGFQLYLIPTADSVLDIRKKLAGFRKQLSDVLERTPLLELKTGKWDDVLLGHIKDKETKLELVARTGANWLSELKTELDARMKEDPVTKRRGTFSIVLVREDMLDELIDKDGPSKNKPLLGLPEMLLCLADQETRNSFDEVQQEHQNGFVADDYRRLRDHGAKWRHYYKKHCHLVYEVLRQAAKRHEIEFRELMTIPFGAAFVTTKEGEETVYLTLDVPGSTGAPLRIEARLPASGDDGALYKGLYAEYTRAKAGVDSATT